MKMKITIERVLDDDKIGRFYDFYRAAFEPLQTLAAARQTRTLEEFAEEMRDSRIEKYIAWNGDTPVGLATMTNDLSSLPWIEPAFYTSRHPRHAAQGTLFYLGYILVDPAPHSGTFTAYQTMSDTVLRRVADAGGVLGFDTSAYHPKRVVEDLSGALHAPGNRLA
jgi:hypothetical protein